MTFTVCSEKNHQFGEPLFWLTLYSYYKQVCPPVYVKDSYTMLKKIQICWKYNTYVCQYITKCIHDLASEIGLPNFLLSFNKNKTLHDLHTKYQFIWFKLWNILILWSRVFPRAIHATILIYSVFLRVLSILKKWLIVYRLAYKRLDLINKTFHISVTIPDS